MKRAMTIMAVATAGVLASAPAHAGEPSLSDQIINSIYADLGMSAKADEVDTKKRSGFFVGVHSGLGAESGLAPVAAGLSIPLDEYETPESVTANGYYVFTTDWSLGTYLGGGFGKFNLNDDPLLNSALPRGNFAYQGMAGLTYSFTPSMALGVEYRYSEAVDSRYLQQTTIPEQEENQSVTLRFDFLLN